MADQILFDEIDRSAPGGLADEIGERLAASAFRLPGSGPSYFTHAFPVKGPKGLNNILIKSHSETSGLIWLLAYPKHDGLAAMERGRNGLLSPPGWPEEVIFPVERLADQLSALMPKFYSGEGEVIVRDPVHQQAYSFSLVRTRVSRFSQKLDRTALQIKPVGIDKAKPVILGWDEAWQLFRFLPSQSLERWQARAEISQRFTGIR